MATYLKFDGNSHIEISPIALGSDFEFEIQMDALDNVSSEQWIVGFWNDTGSERSFALRIKSSQLQTFFSTDGASSNNGPSLVISTGIAYKINVGKRDTTAFISLNGGTESTATVVGGDAFVPTGNVMFGRKNVGPIGAYPLTADVEYIKLFKNSILTNNWDSASSDTSNTGLQPVWEDTLTTNDGQGVGFPTDGTAWYVEATGTLLTDQDDYSFRKRVGNSATHTVSGTYTGSPTVIEYQIDGGGYQVADANPSGGVFSFTVDIPIGESIVDIRFSNDVVTNTSLILVTPDEIIVCSGQSNMSGRGTNNQVYTQTGGVKAYLFGNDGIFKPLVDPYDSNEGQTTATNAWTSDSNAGGSWIVRFAHYWIQNKGTPIAFIPQAKGGTKVEQWQKTELFYPELIRRANEVGGVDAVFYQQGESDAYNEVTTGAQYETLLNQFVNDIQTDLGVETFIIPLHTMTASAYVAGQDAIRHAQIDVAETNDNARIGQPLTDITGLSDGLHFTTDEELDTVGSRVYDSYTAVYSDLVISVSGTPDGTYNTVIVNASNEIVFSGNLVFTSGVSTITGLPLTAGTPLTGFVIDNEITHENGAVITGTTV